MSTFVICPVLFADNIFSNSECPSVIGNYNNNILVIEWPERIIEITRIFYNIFKSVMYYLNFLWVPNISYTGIPQLIGDGKVKATGGQTGWGAI